MIDWFKRLLGFAEVVLSLEEKHSKASKLGEVAVDLFDRAITQLEEAAESLAAVAEEADELARTYGERVVAATAEYEKNIARAAKLRDLLA